MLGSFGSSFLGPRNDRRSALASVATLELGRDKIVPLSFSSRTATRITSQGMSNVLRPARTRAGYTHEGRLRGLAEPAYAGFLCLARLCTGRVSVTKTTLRMPCITSIDSLVD